MASEVLNRLEIFVLVIGIFCFVPAKSQLNEPGVADLESNGQQTEKVVPDVTKARKKLLLDADFEMEQGNYPLALKYLIRAEDHIGNQPSAKADIQLRMARIQLYRGEEEMAREHYKRANENLKKYPNDTLLPGLYAFNAEMAFRNAKYQQAYENALKAQVFYEQFGLKKEQIEILRLLSGIYYEQNKFILARDCARQYFNLARRSNSDHHMANAYNSLAMVYGRFNQVDSALFFAKTALELARAQNALNQKVAAHQTLYSLYELWGRPKDALVHYKRYALLKDGLVGKNKSREIAQLQAVQEVERRKKENDILTERAAAHQSEFKRKELQSQMYLLGLILLVILGAVVAYALNKSRNVNRKLMLLTKEIRDSRDKIKKTSDRLGQTNRKLVKIQAALISQKDMAERASMAKDVFLSSVSHELRTPLTAILGLTDELIPDASSPKERENLEIIKFSGENLLSLVNDILDFNKIQSGKINLEHISYNLKDNLDKLIKALKPRARQNGVELIYEYDPDLPKWVVGDPVRIGQVINNLLSNAIKFTRDANVQLRVGLKGEKENKYEISFEVIDEGIGIPKDRLEHIFERFTQASSDTTRKYGGTGLGLAISKRIVELYRSKIDVTSEPGIGSTFGFTLKLEKGEEIKEPELPDQIEIPSEINILLVEDNRVNQKLVTRTFSNIGIDIDVAGNGEEGYQIVKEGAKDYDVVLMDMHMPKMDGPTATQAIRNLGGSFSDLPIIGLSGSIVKEAHEMKEIGLTAFLQKPFKKEELFHLIAQQLLLH